MNADELKSIVKDSVKKAVAEALQQFSQRLDQIEGTVSVPQLDLDTRTRTVKTL